MWMESERFNKKREQLEASIIAGDTTEKERLMTELQDDLQHEINKHTYAKYNKPWLFKVSRKEELKRAREQESQLTRIIQLSKFYP